MNKVNFKTVAIEGVDIFYREAGDESKPSLLLLHGFPSSSHMYRHLINELSAEYHVVAPDYPGFGQSSSPSPSMYDYTFDNLASTMSRFIDEIKLTRCVLYVHDYGGPIGFRIAAQRPELISALIVQNANAYIEGIGEALQPLVNYIESPNEQTEQEAR
ncbi:MAG TPA: alpha/beta fold hydrolase, partial [Chitinophagaceae bacterium]|nr:alpha/beta fold hydrolase [Chitinophagaceae bacterium]